MGFFYDIGYYNGSLAVLCHYIYATLGLVLFPAEEPLLFLVRQNHRCFNLSFGNGPVLSEKTIFVFLGN